MLLLILFNSLGYNMTGKLQRLNKRIFRNEWYLAMGLFETNSVLNAIPFYFIEDFPHLGTFSKQFINRQKQRWKDWV